MISKMKEDEFKKNIENILQNFDLARKKIGGEKKKIKIINKELQDISDRFNEGKEINGEELQKISEKWESKELLIDEEGNPFVLYIPDWSTFGRYGKPKNPERDNGYRKFHFSWCKTLISMDEKGKSDRYVKETDIENTSFEGKNKDGEKIIKELQSCIFCKNNIKEKVEDSWDESYYGRNHMNLLAFFEKYGKPDFKNKDEFPESLYGSKYPENWKNISRKLREAANWKCKKCDKDCSNEKDFLDVHHLNGVRDDIKIKNLRVLCKKCHSEEPNHEHYKISLKKRGII